jgi:hypothetical protein
MLKRLIQQRKLIPFGMPGEAMPMRREAVLKFIHSIPRAKTRGREALTGAAPSQAIYKNRSSKFRHRSISRINNAN